ncbi:MAG TPA: SWIM zinc finger family protein [Stellaceae bacterium]|nr:SWIM zinc finger family protein [Stellaceae bacterium]
MKASEPRFDIDAVRKLAGPKVFARGEEYFADGQVVILAIEPKRVLAQVAGTEDYRTELTGRGKRIDGSCSCRAFEDWGFCKHMVATALATNAEGEDQAGSGGALTRIRDHLKAKSTAELVSIIMDLVERDAGLFRTLDLAAVATQADADDEVVEARLRRAVDAATRSGGSVDYREAEDWASGVAAVLDAVESFVTSGRARLARQLAEYAIDAIESAARDIDDSDGHCGALLERTGEIHLAACKAARPDPVALARDLFEREMDGTYDTFYRASVRYEDVLGEAGMAEYRRLAQEAWDKLPPKSKRAPHGDDLAHRSQRLKSVLDIFAERDGDLDARIALRARNLSSAWDYLQLANFCLVQGRAEEALQRAEEGLWMFEDDEPDTGLVLFAADLLVKAGRKADAEVRLWSAFEQAPRLDLYLAIRELVGVSSRERASALLEARVTSVPTRDVADLLIRILMHEKMFDAAWAAVRRHGLDLGVRDELARATEATHPREALGVYDAHVQFFATVGGDGAYAKAAKLVARMAKLRSAAEQATYLTELKSRFHRKRKFMTLLE